MRKNILSTLWLAALTSLTFTARPLASSAQEVKTFTEYVMQQNSQSEQDNSDDIRPYMVPYLTSRTHYKVIPGFYSDALYNVSEGAFCLIDKNLLTVWTIDGEYLFGPEWKALGTQGDNNMLFDNGALIAKSAKKNNFGKEFYSILYKDGSVRNLDPSWKPQSGFVDGLAYVTKMQGYQELGNFFINTRGEKFPSPTNLIFGYGCEGKPRALKCGLRAFQVRGHKWGFMDEKGQVVIQPRWDKVRDFSEGYAWTFVRNEGSGNYTATLIDCTGKTVLTTSVVSTQFDLSETYVIGDVRDGKYYVYSDGSEPTTTYYDLKGRKLAVSYGGTSFYEGHALVRGIKDSWDRVFSVDDNFNITDTYSTYSSDGHSIHADELWASNPFDSFGLHTIHSGSVVIDSRGRLVLKELGDMWEHGYIRGFSQPSKDGYIIAKNIMIDDKRFMALVKYTGEIAWLFGEECFTAEDLKGFVHSDDYDENKVVVDCGGTNKKPKGPTEKIDQTYSVKVKCNPAEGGSASVVGKSPIKYGDKVSVQAKPNEGWVVTSIRLRNAEIGEESFSVFENDTATVTFLKRPVIEEINHSNVYQGTLKMKLSGNDYIDVPLYAEMSKEKNICSPFGKNTYGYLALMLDPMKRYVGGSLAVNVYYPPMKIVGMQKEGGKQYIVVDAGSAMYHNLRVVSDNMGANLWFNLMMMMDGFENGSVVPRRYRIEIVQVNDNTGECTLGNLQVFSLIKGWVPGQDRSIRVHTLSKYPTLSGGAHDLGLPSDFFNGCTLKLSKKRDDIRWYPPTEWAKSQTDYQKKVEKMTQTYQNFATDYEKVFGQ